MRCLLANLCQESAFPSALCSAPENLDIGSTVSVVEDAAPSGAYNNQPALLNRGVAVFIAADGDLDDAAYPTTNLFFPPLPYAGRS